MTFPSLNIKNLKAEKPIIQGGMAVRVSRAPLAAAVANCGGIGIIAASGIGKKELREQIQLARKLQKNKKGLLGINIMYAASPFNEMVETAINEGIDLIIFGAGFSRDVFSLGKKSGTPIIPIVSSAKLAKISKKLGAAAVIIEGGEAGGHLGTDRPIRELIPEIREALDSTPNCPDVGEIPIIAAGGITSGFDIMELLELGANAVQIATRFVLSKECDVHENFKKAFMNAKEIVRIQSPVGLPGRAILTPFTQKILNNEANKPKSCAKCLKHCSQSFCIIKALEAARTGDMENGLFFTGANVKKITEILSVKEIFDMFELQAKEFLKQKGICNEPLTSSN